MLDLPRVDDGMPIDPGISAGELQKIAKEPEDRVKQINRKGHHAGRRKSKVPKKTGPAGSGTPKGGLGKGGDGDGPGIGKKQGAGYGGNGPGGRNATKQDTAPPGGRARSLPATPRSAPARLAALGVTVAIPDQNPAGGFFLVAAI